MELYLITGFLGAGKTTFIKNIVDSLKDRKIFLIVNEFGRESIDGTLLRELGLTMSEINNGSIFCTCKIDKFEETLLWALDNAPDVVLVETSGLADPTNIKRILAQDKYQHIDFKGSICLVDATRFAKVVETARVVRRQISISSLVLINKTDLVSPDQVEQIRDDIKQINPQAKIILTSYAKIEKEDFSKMPSYDYDLEASWERDITLQKYLITILPNMTVKQLESFLKMIADETYRIKGFVALGENTLFVDCVGSFIQISEYHSENAQQVNKIVVLAGKGMDTRKSIKEARKWYNDYIVSVE